MPRISIALGGLLCAVSLLAFVVSGMGAEAVTALIPFALGAPIVLCGWIAGKKPDHRKLCMHIAVTLAFLCLAGSASRIPKLEDFSSVKSVSIWASTLISLVLFGAYLQSFIQARLRPTSSES